MAKQRTKSGTHWDVAVVGGGPAGMMAAGRAAELGARVVLLEKNPSLGKKLLITGGGRCNVTNAEPDLRTFLGAYRDCAKFLHSAFAQYSAHDARAFFESRGMPTKIEPGNRVFPTSDRAESVWDVLVKYMKEGGVTVRTSSPVNGFVTKDGTIDALELNDGSLVHTRSYILATGGTSRPDTGSTGEGFDWLRTIGHTVVPTATALVPLAIEERWVKDLQGVTIEHVELFVRKNERKSLRRKGRILFTHFGISGPTVLNMSKEIGELLENDAVTLFLDLLPPTDSGTLQLKLRECLRAQSNKQCGTVLEAFVPKALVPAVIAQAGVDPSTPAHSVTREDRLALATAIKAMPMHVRGLLGPDKAVVSSGGVALPEVDFATMRSRKFENLYLVGDVLDIDRPSGGYSLQISWTTGYVAGTAAAKNPPHTASDSEQGHYSEAATL